MARTGLRTIPIPTKNPKRTAHPYFNIIKKNSDKKKEEINQEDKKEDKTPARASSPPPPPNSRRSTSQFRNLINKFTFSNSEDSSDVSKSHQ